MAVLLITPLLSERARLPGIVGLILGGMLIGPHGFDLLKVDDRIELLSTIGLLYLMFSAGLEVNLTQFTRVRGKALIFGVLTYMIPQIMGLALGMYLHLGWLGSILLGSAFSSHTLIAFPILVKLGIVRNEAISVSIGATVLTDITAFVVLAAVLSATSGAFTLAYFARLVVLLAIYAAGILLVVPRLGKLFFRRFHGRAVEFQFVLVTLMLSALFAELIGVHEVVGAFLAGLAINATLPHHSPVGERVLFLGESFFIPVFLMYSGMITDPLAFVVDSHTIVLALSVTLVAYLSKFIAAWGAGKIFRYTQAEMLTVYGLTHAQAAVTIPTLLIGVQTGLFSQTLFNAAILMILLTSITSPILVQRFGRKVESAGEEEDHAPLFERVLVSIANPETQEYLITLAGILAYNHNGELVVLNVVHEDNRPLHGENHAHRNVLEHVPAILNNPEARYQLVRRIDDTVSRGVLRASAEQQATMIVTGWRGRVRLLDSALGQNLDEIVWGAKIPVLVGRITAPIYSMQRIVLVIPQDRLDTALARGTLETVSTMAQALNVPLLIMGKMETVLPLKSQMELSDGENPPQIKSLSGDLLTQIHQETTPQDLLVVPTVGSRTRFRSSLGNLPDNLTQSTTASIVFFHCP
jgi:Kef-type K+ transport system membrane component KefB/nucleotide-binding universal stress UspA family protein